LVAEIVAEDGDKITVVGVWFTVTFNEALTKAFMLSVTLTFKVYAPALVNVAVDELAVEVTLGENVVVPGPETCDHV
jgi:hypothetical protein